MKPIDYRDATFEGLREQLAGLRRAAYGAWLAHGPGTTRQVAERSGMELLTLRPRTTELVEAGLVRCVGGCGGEGIYEAVPASEWETWVRQMRGERVEGQLLMKV